MIKFLIESSICIALFYGVYWFFLRKEKFLSLNRYYLMGAVLVSMIIPLLEFSFQTEWTTPVRAAYNFFPITETSVDQVPVTKTRVLAFSLSNLYLAGLFLSAVLLLVRFCLTIKRSGLKLSLKRKGIQIVNSEGYQAFSFLNTIVLGSEIERDPDLRKTIMLHEMAHVKGRHSMDLLLMELLRCLYWFNPFIYFSISSLKTQHEYIADAHVLREVSPNTYERNLATITLGKIDQSLVHGFGKLPLERRIKMIYNTNSNVMNKFKLLLVLPVLALLVFQFGCADDPFQGIEEEGEMKASIAKTVNGIHLSVDGVVTRNTDGYRITGKVTDLDGAVIEGAKVGTDVSETTVNTLEDGSFTLMVDHHAKELILSHPSRKSTRLELMKFPALQKQQISELPVTIDPDIHPTKIGERVIGLLRKVEASAEFQVLEGENEMNFDGAELIEEQEIEVKNLKIKEVPANSTALDEEIVLEEAKPSQQKTKGTVSYLKKRKN